MTNKSFKKRFALLMSTFVFVCLAVNWAYAEEKDTKDSLAHVSIIYKSSYPGHFAEVEVKLKNEVEIAGFQFMITISNPDLFNFHTDSIRVDTIVIPVDTCTGPPPHGDSCFVDSLIPTPVRYCYIDTVGSLISGFELVQCHGGVGDTSLPDCKWITILGMAKYGEPILPDANYRRLFRFGVDVFCLPDSTTDRTSSFYAFPSVFNFLSDPLGDLVPYEYHQGELTVWWGVPGDASGDSVINLGDIVYLIEYLYRYGPPPCIPETGDVTGDCVINIGDVVYLIEYLYRYGPAPVPGCWHGKKEE